MHLSLFVFIYVCVGDSSNPQKWFFSRRGSVGWMISCYCIFCLVVLEVVYFQQILLYHVDLIQYHTIEIP